MGIIAETLGPKISNMADDAVDPRELLKQIRKQFNPTQTSRLAVLARELFTMRHDVHEDLSVYFNKIARIH